MTYTPKNTESCHPGRAALFSEESLPGRVALPGEVAFTDGGGIYVCGVVSFRNGSVQSPPALMRSMSSGSARSAGTFFILHSLPLYRLTFPAAAPMYP